MFVVEESKEGDPMEPNSRAAVNLRKYSLLTVAMIRRGESSMGDAGQRTGLGQYLVVLCVSGEPRKDNPPLCMHWWNCAFLLSIVARSSAIGRRVVDKERPCVSKHSTRIQERGPREPEDGLGRLVFPARLPENP